MLDLPLRRVRGYLGHNTYQVLSARSGSDEERGTRRDVLESAFRATGPCDRMAQEAMLMLDS